ncbi:MAG: phosphoadenylyl-sulfate reductase [Acidimicrobiales bacterium]
MPADVLSTPLSPQRIAPPSGSGVVASRPALDAAAVADADRRLANATPTEVIRWSVDTFGPRLVVTTSFADTTLLALAVDVEPDIEVVFLDTGFHFAETLGLLRRAMDRYGLNLTVLRPHPSAVDVWSHDDTSCCQQRKVDPLDRYLTARADAWISGLRRADSPERADQPIVSIDRRGLVKVNPLAAMTDEDHAALLVERDILVNPLHAEGYDSIGCWPCTRPGTGRDGRWGATKTECGLHL